MHNSLLIILGIGLIQSAIFALLTLQKRRKSLSDWILFFWFFSFCVHFGSIILVELNGALFYVVLAKNLLLLYGPFLWLYTYASYSRITHRSLGLQFPHFLPFVGLILSGLLIHTNQSNTYEAILVITKLASLIAYPVYVLYWLKKKSKSLKTERADDFITFSNWLTALAYLILFNGFLGFVHVLGDISSIISFSEVLDILTYVVIITIMGYLGLKHGIMVSPGIRDDLTIKKSYSSSPLTISEKNHLKTEITNYLNTTKDYLDHEFSLSALSEKLNTPKHHLSEVINSEMNSTFYDLINSRRIEYALHRIKNTDDVQALTLEGLGYESGFNTKSAFYRHFKFYTGKTPGQVKKEKRPD